MLAAEYNAILVHDGGPYYNNMYQRLPYTNNLSAGFARYSNGKASEFKERKAYDIGTSFATHGKDIDMTHEDDFDSAPADCPDEPETVPTETHDADYAENIEYLLFKTHTCPNCAMLEKNGILNNYPVTKIFAEDEENRELVDKFGIQSAPTLVVCHDGKADIYAGVSAIIGFVNQE
jgi:hypothetical protein